MDRALDYVALADSGLSAARIARKRRRSAGYVSILLRLGRAIATLEPADLAALRSPRVTWKLAQRVVRADADAGSIRHQLRLALGGFSTHNVDRRKHRTERRPASTTPPRAGTAWGWDDAWFTRDPVDYVRHHLAHLTAVHRAVVGRAARAVTQGTARRLSVGQSLAVLQRALAATPAPPHSAPPGTAPTPRVSTPPGSGSAASAVAPPGPERSASGSAGPAAPGPAAAHARRAEERALAALALIERQLALAGEEVAALLGDGATPAGARPAPARTTPHPRADPPPAPPGPAARSARQAPPAAPSLGPDAPRPRARPDPAGPTAAPTLPFEVDEDLAG